MFEYVKVRPRIAGSATLRGKRGYISSIIPNTTDGVRVTWPGEGTYMFRRQDLEPWTP